MDARSLLVDAVEAAMSDDRRWFRRHLGEVVRYRAMVPGEFDAAGYDDPDGSAEQAPTAAAVLGFSGAECANATEVSAVFSQDRAEIARSAGVSVSKVAVMVEVRQLRPGLSTRRPYFVAPGMAVAE